MRGTMHARLGVQLSHTAVPGEETCLVTYNRKSVPIILLHLLAPRRLCSLDPRTFSLLWLGELAVPSLLFAVSLSQMCAPLCSRTSDGTSQEHRAFSISSTEQFAELPRRHFA